MSQLVTSSHHIACYYTYSTHLDEARSKLTGIQNAQTVIIGGGFAGVTTALELARGGHDVVLLEGKRIGWGASGRNGGFVSDGFAQGFDAILTRVGREKTKRLFALSVGGCTYIEERIKELPNRPIMQGSGGLSLMRHGGARGFEQTIAKRQDLFGENLHILTGDELKKQVNSKRYHSGIYKKSAFHIQPLTYALGLAELAEKAGARLFENSHAIHIERREGAWFVQTTDGSVKADNIVIATSAYNGPFSLAERAIVKVATYVMATEPLGERLNTIIPFRGTVADTRRAGDYFRTVDEGDERRLIWGGRISTRIGKPSNLAHHLKRDMTQVFPQLVDAKIQSCWSGLMAYPKHKMPLIGHFWPKRYPNLWLNTGFGGHGLNTCAMGGKLVANALLKGDDTWRIFENYPPQWTGGIVGRVAAQMSYWSMQWKDERDECLASDA